MSARQGQLYGEGVAGEWWAWCRGGERVGLGGGAAPRDWHVVAVALTYPRVGCSVLLRSSDRW